MTGPKSEQNVGREAESEPVVVPERDRLAQARWEEMQSGPVPWDEFDAEEARKDAAFQADLDSHRRPPEKGVGRGGVMLKLGLLVLGGFIVVGGLRLYADAHQPPPPPQPQPQPRPTVAFPNVIDMSGENAQRTIGELFPNGGALTESRDAYEYSVANRCLWRDPAGEMSSTDSWPVTSVVRFLHPEIPVGTSPTEPVEAGTRFEKLDRLYFELHTEKPADVWCQPYGDPGPAGGAPNVGVPNHDDDGESWFCRRHRWC